MLGETGQQLLPKQDKHKHFLNQFNLHLSARFHVAKEKERTGKFVSNMSFADAVGCKWLASHPHLFDAPSDKNLGTVLLRHENMTV